MGAAVFAALCLLTLDLSSGWRLLLPGLAWAGFTGLIAFLIGTTGRVSRWRAVFFIVIAWAFMLNFKASSLGLRGSAFTSAEIQEVPYCHIAIASSILNPLYSEYLALKSGHWRKWGPLSLGMLWLVVTLALGQAWCSWACFYGGLDEGFSRVLRKPALRWFRLPGPLRDLPAGILLACVFLSLSAMVPVFCLWACPLKLTTAFLDPIDTVRKVQLSVFVFLAAATLVVGPLLTKKRLFCGLICPFGAWQSFWGSLNPFRVSIWSGRCTQCGLCLKACPTFAISEAGLKEHRVEASCNRCGECMQACPSGAVVYTFAGMPRHDVGMLFIFCALLVGGAVGGLFVPECLVRLTQAAGELVR